MLRTARHQLVREDCVHQLEFEHYYMLHLCPLQLPRSRGMMMMFIGPQTR